MGINANGSIFGIRIYNFNDDDFCNTLFEETYNVIMSCEQKKDAFLFYNELNNKNEIRFKYYTECSSTYGKAPYIMWHPLSLDQFLDKLCI